MSEDKRKKLPHPCQPVADDGTGVTRFKENAIVRWLVDEHDRLSVLRHEHCLNRIAAMDFSREDRVQFAQLIGYSLSGWSTLSCVTEADYEVAQSVAEDPTVSSLVARVEALREQLEFVRSKLREGLAVLYEVHPDDFGPLGGAA